jgi:hypothetical protein
VRNIAALAGTFVQPDPTTTASPRAGAAGPCRRPRVEWAAALARHEVTLFVLLTLVQLVPVWAFTYLPTTDGAAHVANAQVMRKIGDPALGAFRHYYVVSNAPIPNLIGHMVLAGLLYAVPPVAAEKILVSLYMVLFPLAVRYAVRAIRPRATPLAFLAFPMVYSYLFAQGFYNFVLSCGVFFFVVGYWVRNRDRLNVWRGFVLMALGLLLYSCHLFSLMMACGVIGVLTAWFGWREIRPQSPDLAPDYKKALNRAIITVVAILPSFALALTFRPATPPPGEPIEQSIRDEIIALMQFTSMVSYRAREAWLGAALVCVMGALALMVLLGKVVRGSWTRWDALLIMPAGLVAVYFKAQDAVALHFYIPHRVMFYVFLTLILWLAGQPMTRRVRWAVVPAAAVVSLAFVASHAMKYREFAPQLNEFVAAGDQIPRNSTFLPLIFSTRGRTAQGHVSSIDVQPFFMASGYIAARRDAVDLKNYEANTDHFPVRFKPEVNPYTHLAGGDGFDVVPPRVDLANFRRAGGEVDYVLVWGLEDTFRDNKDVVRIYDQITKDYDPVPLPNVHGHRTELWKRKGL